MGSDGPTGPQRHISLTRAAGRKPIITVGSPGVVMGPPTWGIGGMPGITIGQVCMSVSRAAGGMTSVVDETSGSYLAYGYGD